MDIVDTLAQIRAQDQKKFLLVRTNMRKAYLMSIAATVGIASYQTEDDTFMDALDIKVEMLMHRAGIDTIKNDNSSANENASDPFAIITRPAAKTEIKDNITSMPAAPAWGEDKTNKVA